jgi:hypothetical protein
VLNVYSQRFPRSACHRAKKFLKCRRLIWGIEKLVTAPMSMPEEQIIYSINYSVSTFLKLPLVTFTYSAHFNFLHYPLAWANAKTPHTRLGYGAFPVSVFRLQKNQLVRRDRRYKGCSPSISER